MDQSRGDVAIFMARRFISSWGAQPSEDAWRAEMLRQRYPYYRLEDASPHIDALRMMKTPLEIEALRRNGWVSAEAHRRAIAITRAGLYEYEIEAEAAYVMLKNGAEGNGYPAIVGSGPNGTVWHYQENSRQLQDGDLVVMDYGASLGYQTIDITRTRPVSGKFDDRYSGGAGHFTGMSVHDVGDYNAPLRAGMVIAVEPIIEIKERNIHIRIEDTVLITEEGPEVMSAHVPKEVDELLALAGSRGNDLPPR